MERKKNDDEWFWYLRDSTGPVSHSVCVSPIKQRYLIIFLSFFSNSQIIILSPLLPSVNDQVGVFVHKFLIIIFLGGGSGERGVGVGRRGAVSFWRFNLRGR